MFPNDVKFFVASHGLAGQPREFSSFYSNIVLTMKTITGKSQEENFPRIRRRNKRLLSIERAMSGNAEERDGKYQELAKVHRIIDFIPIMSYFTHTESITWTGTMKLFEKNFRSEFFRFL